jgi:hypothetical protein
VQMKSQSYMQDKYPAKGEECLRKRIRSINGYLCPCMRNAGLENHPKRQISIRLVKVWALSLGAKGRALEKESCAIKEGRTDE